MAWINGFERKRFDEEQKRLAEEYRIAGMTEEQIEQMYQFDLVEFNSRRRFSEHTQQLSLIHISCAMLHHHNTAGSDHPGIAWTVPQEICSYK